jgi:hypothetical protein
MGSPEYRRDDGGMTHSLSAPGGLFASLDFDYEAPIVLGAAASVGFTQAQGANFHCQPTGRQLTHTQMLDFPADHLPSRKA